MVWTLEEVKSFTQKAHTGQKRWSGADYYEDHLLEVLENTKEILKNNRSGLDHLYKESGYTEYDVYAAALLHDVLEDTETSYQTIVSSFGENVAKIVQVLTRPRDQEYSEYIYNFVDNPEPEYVFATIVKIADIDHNSSNFPVEKRNNKYSKYLLSKRILEDYLEKVLY